MGQGPPSGPLFPAAPVGADVAAGNFRPPLQGRGGPPGRIGTVGAPGAATCPAPPPESPGYLRFKDTPTAPGRLSSRAAVCYNDPVLHPLIADSTTDEG